MAVVPVAVIRRIMVSMLTCVTRGDCRRGGGIRGEVVVVEVGVALACGLG